MCQRPIGPWAYRLARNIVDFHVFRPQAHESEGEGGARRSVATELDNRKSQHPVCPPFSAILMMAAVSSRLKHLATDVEKRKAKRTFVKEIPVQNLCEALEALL